MADGMCQECEYLGINGHESWHWTMGQYFTTTWHLHLTKINCEHHPHSQHWTKDGGWGQVKYNYVSSYCKRTSLEDIYLHFVIRLHTMSKIYFLEKFVCKVFKILCHFPQPFLGVLHCIYFTKVQYISQMMRNLKVKYDICLFLDILMSNHLFFTILLKIINDIELKSTLT